MNDPLFDGVMHSLTKSASLDKEALAPLLGGLMKGVGMLGRLGISAVKKAPGTTIGAAFALPTSYGIYKGLSKNEHTIPKPRGNLNIAPPQGQPRLNASWAA